jgi:signal transduction histidine kinase
MAPVFKTHFDKNQRISGGKIRMTLLSTMDDNGKTTLDTRIKELESFIMGIAHQINNPNATILLDAQSLERGVRLLLQIIDERQILQATYELGEFSYDDLRNELLQSIQRIIRNAKRICHIPADSQGATQSGV